MATAQNTRMYNPRNTVSLTKQFDAANAKAGETFGLGFGETEDSEW